MQPKMASETDSTNSKNSQTPPTKPTGDDQQKMQGDENMTMGDEGERPELPDGEEMKDGETMEQPDGGNFDPTQMQGMMSEMNQNSINPAIYLSIGAGSVILSMLIFWTILSKFFKYGFKDTLKNTKKVLIFVIGSLILSAGICVGSYFLLNNSQSVEMPEMTMPSDFDPNSEDGQIEDVENSDDKTDEKTSES